MPLFPALCGPTVRCADMSDTAPPLWYQIFVLSPLQDPQRAWAATLKCSTALDRGKAAVSCTLDAPPRQTRSTARPTATAMPSTGATGQRHILGTVKGLPRMTTTLGAVPHSARQQEPSTVLPRFGEKGTTPEITRACNPSLLESINGERSAQAKQSRLSHRQPLALSSPHIGPCLNQL